MVLRYVLLAFSATALRADDLVMVLPLGLAVQCWKIEPVPFARPGRAASPGLQAPRDGTSNEQILRPAVRYKKAPNRFVEVRHKKSASAPCTGREAGAAGHVSAGGTAD